MWQSLSWLSCPALHLSRQFCKQLLIPVKFLQTSLSQERQSRVSVEGRLRDATGKATSTERELKDAKSLLSEKEGHCQSLQQSVSLSWS